LIVDEPSNDVVVLTVNGLESFLEDFGGCLIIVSHDRFFMDRLVQHYFVFEGEGRIRDFHGTYQEYRDELAQQEAGGKKKGATRSKPELKKEEPKPSGRGLTYKEKKTFQKLGKEIEILEKEQMEVEKKLSGTDLNPEELEKETVRYDELQQQLDQKGTEWLELAERDR
ncbi:MAG: ABC transporter ATP-binding protein, partial [Balneolaceae bacterium]